VQKQKYLKTLWSTLVLQTFSRRCLNRNFYLSMVQSSVAVQRTWRGFVAQLQYHYDLMDIILVQSIVRCQIVRKDAKKRQDAALKIQCFCRSTLARVKTAMLQSKNAFFLGTVVFCQVSLFTRHIILILHFYRESTSFFFVTILLISCRAWFGAD
jgi:hypothetical protein